MSNDDETRRLAALLNNVDLSSLLSLASSQVNSRPGLATSHGSVESSSSISASAFLSALSALSGRNSAPAPAPAASSNNTNDLVLSALLSSTSNQAQVTLAQLLGMISTSQHAPAQSQAPAPAASAQFDLQRLLQGPRPESSTSRSSHASAFNSADQRILALLQTPPSANTVTVSVDAVLALLNSGMDREQMIALFRQLQNSPSRHLPAPTTRSLQAFLQQSSNQDSARNSNSTNSGSNQLSTQLSTNLQPSSLATLLAAHASQQRRTTQTSTASTTNTGPHSGLPSTVQVSDAPAASSASGEAEVQAQVPTVISTDMGKSKSSSSKKVTKKKRKTPPPPDASLPRAPKGLTGHRPQTLYSPGDDERLSAFHVLARKNMEFFEADQEDVTTNARGRNRAITLGQVGIRCKHCSFIPPRFRDRGAMYYPFKLELLYQACQTLSQVHLSEHCKHVPKQTKLRLKRLKQENATALVGKKYWAETARCYGIYETVDGMRFRAPKTTVDPPTGEQKKEDEEEDNGSASKKRKAV